MSKGLVCTGVYMTQRKKSERPPAGAGDGWSEESRKEGRKARERERNGG